MSEAAGNIRTVYLGQFTHEHAEAMAAEFEAAGIVWWAKVPGLFTVIWERDVRLFVDRARLAEAESIAARVLADDQAEGSASGQS